MKFAASILMFSAFLGNFSFAYAEDTALLKQIISIQQAQMNNLEAKMKKLEKAFGEKLATLKAENQSEYNELKKDINGLGGAIKGGDNTRLPKNSIIIWAGNPHSVPEGFALCDGTKGTPDLTDKFVVGAGKTYRLGGAGGALSVTLEASNMPVHEHSLNLTTKEAGEHGHEVIDPGHMHNLYQVSVDSEYYAKPGDFGAWIGPGVPREFSAAVAQGYTRQQFANISLKSSGVHSHAILGNTGSAGAGQPFSIMPPYYSLAYIMKL